MNEAKKVIETYTPAETSQEYVIVAAAEAVSSGECAEPGVIACVAALADALEGDEPDVLSDRERALLFAYHAWLTRWAV